MERTTDGWTDDGPLSPPSQSGPSRASNGQNYKFVIKLLQMLCQLTSGGESTWRERHNRHAMFSFCVTFRPTS